MAGICRGFRFLIRQHRVPLIDYRSCRLAIEDTSKISIILGQRSSCFTTITDQINNDSRTVYTGSNINLEQRRFKKKRSSKRAEEEEEEEEENDDDLANENPLLMDDLLNQTNDGSERLTISISSLRLDTFCKTAFSMTRAKVEELFYKGDIYVNGELPAKKSQDISVGDEVDVVKSINPEDNRFVNVKRAVILKLPDKASEHGRMKLDIQRWMDLSIESRSHKSDNKQ